MHEVVDAGELVGYEVDSPETGVAVGGGEGHEAVGEVVFVHEAGKLAAHVGSVAHGLVPVADNGLGNERGEVVIVLPTDTLDGDGDVGGGDGVVTDADLGANEVGLGLGGLSGGVGGGVLGTGGQATEVLLGKLDKLLVRDATSTDEDHAVGGVVGLDVADEVVTLDALDVLGRAQDGASKGLVLEGNGVEVVKHDLLELLVDLLGFAEDNIALTLDRLRLELGVLEDIGKNVDGSGDIGVEGLSIVDGVFTRGVCV